MCVCLCVCVCVCMCVRVCVCMCVYYGKLTKIKLNSKHWEIVTRSKGKRQNDLLTSPKQIGASLIEGENFSLRDLHGSMSRTYWLIGKRVPNHTHPQYKMRKLINSHFYGLKIAELYTYFLYTPSKFIFTSPDQSAETVEYSNCKLNCSK